MPHSQGRNVTVFCYGMTGTGKSHTMAGSKADPGTSHDSAAPPTVASVSLMRCALAAGIVPRAVAQLFRELREPAARRDVCVKASFLEIYNERCFDLLAAAGSATELPLRENHDNEVVVAGLTEVCGRVCPALPPVPHLPYSRCVCVLSCACIYKFFMCVRVCTLMFHTLVPLAHMHRRWCPMHRASNGSTTAGCARGKQAPPSSTRHLRAATPCSCSRCAPLSFALVLFFLLYSHASPYPFHLVQRFSCSVKISSIRVSLTSLAHAAASGALPGIDAAPPRVHGQTAAAGPRGQVSRPLMRDRPARDTCAVSLAASCAGLTHPWRAARITACPATWARAPRWRSRHASTARCSCWAM